MSTSISEHARQEDGISKEAAFAALAECRDQGPDNCPIGYHVQQAIDSATAAKEREFLQYCAQLERDKLDMLAQWKQQDEALQARVRELESYETNYHSLQVRLTELENQLIQKFKP